MPNDGIFEGKCCGSTNIFIGETNRMRNILFVCYARIGAHLTRSKWNNGRFYGILISSETKKEQQQ